LVLRLKSTVGSLAKVQWINKGSQIVPVNILNVERDFEAEYIADLCIREVLTNNWSEEPYAVFWTPIIRKPEHSCYFGIRPDYSETCVVNAISVTEGVWVASESNDGEIIFSRFRHDNRISKDRSAMVDGGREYLRYRGKIRELKIVGSDFEMVK